MNKLLAYLNGLSRPDQIEFARRCGTTVGYLRKAISTRQKLSEKLTINIERESCRVVACEDIRDDVDWKYLRSSITAVQGAANA
jgi:DNA-binding transcriptional regulator YdaS (Cro superfamily)